jgi:hypothetical protein
MYQDTVHHLFIDHTERSDVSDLHTIDSADPDRSAPIVNMVSIDQILDRTPDPTESLHEILEESPHDELLEGSTRTISSCPTFPLGFRGMIFAVSANSGMKHGETPKEREARRAKNTEHQQRRNEEAARVASGNRDY